MACKWLQRNAGRNGRSLTAGVQRPFIKNFLHFKVNTSAFHAGYDLWHAYGKFKHKGKILPLPERRLVINIQSASYNAICEQWHTFRKQTTVPPCVHQFADRIRPGGHILDIGCGTGFPLDAYLAERHFSLTGIDISCKMLQKATSLALPKAQFLLCDVMRFQPAQLFDGILAFDSLWHVPLEHQSALYPLLSSWLRPGGSLLFTHGKRHGSVEGKMYGHSFYYSALDAEEVYTLLHENGFCIEYAQEDIYEPSMGDRDLLVLAVKQC